jgi:hypothetical protein
MSIFSQAKFLYGIAELTQSLTKISHWWLGLTDLGKIKLFA